MYRKSTSGDCAGIYSLICELENKSLPYDSFSAIYENQMSDSRYYCLVYEADGKVAAALNMRFEGQLHHAEYIGEILEFVVAPSHRCRGLGREMFSLACEIAREHGCNQIELATNNLRRDAHRFYENQGMKNFHFKYSMRLSGTTSTGNTIGV